MVVSCGFPLPCLVEGKLRQIFPAEPCRSSEVVDCNGRAVSVFDGRGVLLTELSGKHLPRKVETESAAGAEVGWQVGGFNMIYRNRNSIQL